MKGDLYNSCPVRSGADQMTNYLGAQSDGAGVNGIKLVHKASSERKSIAIEDCLLPSSKASLANLAKIPDGHIRLTEYSVRKQNHVDFDRNEAKELFNKIKAVNSSLNTTRQETML